MKTNVTLFLFGITVLFFVVGLVFKIFKIQGGTILILTGLSFLLLAVIYIVKDSRRDKKK